MLQVCRPRCNYLVSVLMPQGWHRRLPLTGHKAQLLCQHLQHCRLPASSRPCIAASTEDFAGQYRQSKCHSRLATPHSMYGKYFLKLPHRALQSLAVFSSILHSHMRQLWHATQPCKHAQARDTARAQASPLSSSMRGAEHCRPGWRCSSSHPRISGTFFVCMARASTVPGACFASHPA